MSCQLNVQSSFRDIEGVRKFLFLKSSFEEDDADWKNDDWEWKDDVTENNGNKENDVKGLGETWLQECVIALSPTNDVIAVAYEDRIVILEQKYDPSENSGELETKFNTVWQGSLAQENGEEITALACIPLASQKKSTQGGPDWTCLVAGFTSGYIRIYTENGTLLLSQLFHEEVVSQIKCRTYQLPRFPGLPEQPEDLSILYTKALVTIDGFSLYQSLRVCRNQVARATASGSDVIQPPPLAYKKWGLQGQEFIKDHISCGVVTPNPFDQMQTASMLGGYKAKVKATPPASNLYLTAGSGPYTGFYYAIEGSGQPILTDVALAVASKLKSALFNAASGWLGFGGSAKKAEEQKDKKPKIEPATALGIRFGIPDRRRIGESIVLSPTNTLAATTDSFGRVLLIDVAKGITVRMWKGYRDAQLGFVDVKEDGRGSKQSTDRAALFLIIYAPRRGILEVWATQQGARVAAFNVHKGCQLVCLSHGMMGLNSSTAKSVKTPNLQCCLIEPDGNIRAIEIPFHLALSDKNSRRARDMHLLKTMKTHLKENHQQTDGLCADISSAMTDIKQAGVKQQAIERILSTRYLSAKYMQSVLNELIAQFEPQDPLSAASAEGEETESLDIESRMLLQYCKLQEQLLQTYIAIDTLNTECASTPRPEVNEQIFSQDMGISESEVTYLIKKFDKYNVINDQPERKVQFSETTELSAADFLGCFSCQLHISAQEDIATARNVNLKKSLTEEKRLKLATFIFRSSIQGSAATELGLLLQFCEIPEDQLMDLVLELWLSEDAVDWTTMPNLYNLMHSITQLKDISDINVDHNKQSPWWQNVRDKCCASFNPSAALGAVITGRSVATSLQASQQLPENQNEEKQESSMDVLEADWESLTMDMTHWNILVKQLEDVLAISALLKLQPKGEIKTKGERISVSVNKLLEGGRGVMAEVVAKWIAQNGILPIMLCQKSHNASEEEMETDEHDEESEFLGQLEDVQRRLPHSLDSDVLMANCSWEYIVLWNKDPEVVSSLLHSVEYLQCIQNAVLQHGVCIMMWNMFLKKKLMTTAQLIEKVGKAPKDRLCRRDVGLSDSGLVKFVETMCEFLKTMMQANCNVSEIPIFNIEDMWQTIKGPTPLAELAVDQRETNYGLLLHHFHLTVVLNAILDFTMKSVKPISLFDAKGKAAFFKELHSHPLLPTARTTDSSVRDIRKQFMKRVITHAVQTLRDPDEKSLDSTSLKSKEQPHIKWPSLMQTLAEDFGLDQDELTRHHVLELYSIAEDKLAEEVLLAVSDNAVMGSQLLLLAGQRVAHFMLKCDPPGCTEMLANMSPTLSTWIRQLDFSTLHCANPPLSETATLMGHVVNQLSEGHSEYNLAIALVEVVQGLM